MIVSYRRPTYRPAFSFDPFAEIDRAFAEIARVFEAPARPATPTFDAAWREGNLVLTVHVPGSTKERSAVRVQGRTLAIEVQTDRGSWNRSINIGPALDPAAVSAAFANQTLTVTIGARPVPEVRSIEIADAPALPAATDAAGAETPAEPAFDVAAEVAAPAAEQPAPAKPKRSRAKKSA